MREKNWLKKNAILVVGILFLGLSLVLDSVALPWLTSFYVNQKLHWIQQDILDKEHTADKMLANLASMPPEKLFRQQREIYRQSNDKHIFLYIIQDAQLRFWTTNTAAPQKIQADAFSHLQQLGNGKYLQKNILRGNVAYIALIPIEYKYPYENQYLQNRLALNGAENLDLKFLLSRGRGKPYFNEDKQYLFSLAAEPGPKSLAWITTIFLLGVALCAISIHRRMVYFIKRGNFPRAAGLFLILTGSATFFWKILKAPHTFFAWPGFSAVYYGNPNLFASLGDLFIFTVLLAYSVYFILLLKRISFANSTWNKVFSSINIIAGYLFSALIVKVIRSLVLDSLISFDLSNIFSLNFYSFVGIFIIISWIAILIVWCYIQVKNSYSLYDLPVQWITFLIVNTVMSLLILRLIAWPFWIGAGYAFLCYLGFYISLKRNYIRKLQSLAYYTVLSALFVTIILSRYNIENQLEEQRVVAARIINERDAIAEFLFNNVYDNLQNDIYVQNYFINPILSQIFLQKRIEQIYFSGYFSRFDIDVSSFTPEGIPFKRNFDRPLPFYEHILESSDKIIPNRLFFVHSNTGVPFYISILPVYHQGKLVGTILIQFRQKAFYEESVYPELLVSGGLQRLRDLNDYSYAIYNNRAIVNQRGGYTYPSTARLNVKLDSTNYGSFVQDGYRHMVYQPRPGLNVVVSSPEKGLLYYVSIFSFMVIQCFLAYGIFMTIPIVTRFLRKSYVRNFSISLPGKIRWRDFSFRNKILFTVISGMTLALLLIGLVTVEYIVYQYNKDELDNLRKKARFISIRIGEEMQNRDRGQLFTEDELNAMLKSLSETYQSDINVFDAAGNLLNSTQSIIYDRQVISPKMPPLAYMKFSNESISQLIQEEKIGTLKFTSAYMPIRNAVGQVVGYLNLPYFSKEKELQARISSFLVALVNLYLLLFLILLTIGILMTRTLILPLDIIRNHLRNTRLNESNKPIEWHTEDEIGKLVQEYNTMLVKLRESANKLAQSEREGAWREMAKQVAHEIKNPLTPMKLQIQRLQRAYQEGADDVDSIFKKVTALLIKQIDNLSDIATAFSAFAKMPEGSPSPVDVNTVVSHIHALFSQGKNIQVTVSLADEKLEVFIDEAQLERILNNLVTNSIQAIPEERSGHIKISTSLIDVNTVRIAVQDNGTGIPVELHDKIFTPNFSTKTSGMGLGLAIVKIVVEKAGGHVHFTTHQNAGTTFYLDLPRWSTNF
jgi:signal transduction histidine kinase